MRKLELLKAEDEGIHFIYKASVILVVFDSKSLKSQQESTKIFKNIQNHLESEYYNLNRRNYFVDYIIFGYEPNKSYIK